MDFDRILENFIGPHTVCVYVGVNLGVLDFVVIREYWVFFGGVEVLHNLVCIGEHDVFPK